MTRTRGIAIIASLLAVAGTPACKEPLPPSLDITVTAVSPATGALAGGTSVTITGTNFVAVTSVTIGGNELGSRAVVSASEITGMTPAATSFGAQNVVVSSISHVSGTCRGCFSYVLGVLAQPVAAGYDHTCALNSAGAAYCWGDNSNGQLGTGSTTKSATPVAVVGGLRFTALSAGDQHACGLTASGTAYCWGWNEFGQLGNGSTTNSSTPVAVSGGLTFSALSAGSGHTCGLISTGAAYCWGYGGQLGDGSTTDSPIPVDVTGGVSFSALSAGGYHTCGLTPSGAAYCWGLNHRGQLGIGTFSGPESCPRGHVPPQPCSTIPLAVTTALRWASITTGHAITCAVTQDGQGYCWGDNMVGELGNGSFTYGSATPIAVGGGLSFSALDPGGSTTSYDHTCGLTRSVAAYCWGANYSGQLGNGSTTNSPLPVAVTGGLSFSALAAGGLHTCGRTTTGAIYCWGSNARGELGNGTNNDSSVPVKVAGQR